MLMHRGLPQAMAFTAKAACCSACFLLTFLPATASAGTYSGGSGTKAEPYRISSVPDWQELMATPADWKSHFVLTANIDLNDVPVVPIGNSSNQFTGVFDGNDYIIRNADVNMPGSDYVGLFGYLGRGGQIKNLGVEDASILGDYCVGGLVGYNGWEATISNCYSTGPVSGEDAVGGLVGVEAGIVSNCYSTGSVIGTGEHVGGLVGYNYDGSISNCYSTGSVGGGGTGYYLGGLVGETARGTISRSFWDVNTSGWKTSSGGTGKTTIQMQDINTFLDSGWDFVKETANGTCNFWLMLESGGYPVLSTFNGCIPAEPPGSGTEAEPYIITDANELGAVWYRPSACYVMANDIDLAGMTWSGAVVPFFSGVFDGNDHVIRNVDVNVPGGDYLGLFGYLGPDGQIKNLGVENISIVGKYRVGALVGYSSYGTISDCYSTGSVSADWDVGGLVGSNRSGGTIVNCYSTGSVAGSSGVGGLVGYNSGATTNCYSTGSVSATDYAGGLVGYNSGATTNCYSTGSVSGAYDYVGGLVGYNSGATTNCYSTGSVSGAYDYVGGLAGYNNSGTISRCYASGSVSGGSYVGGLAGYSVGKSITNCYSSGSVSGTGYYVAGLVGQNGKPPGRPYPGWIRTCYSTGTVSGVGGVGGLVGAHVLGEVADSFWDVETSEQSSSAGGTPKTTAEMMTKSTFTSAGWDFIGETANGTEDIWAICEGTNYPRFVYQIPQGDIICPDGVNGFDYSILGRYWHETDCAALNDCEGADMDLSGAVDFGDVADVAESWLRGVR